MKIWKLLFITLLFFAKAAHAQDFNCRVQIITTQVQTTNNQIFNNLQQSIMEFVNNRKWAKDKLAIEERIEWSLILNISQFDNVSAFKATAQVQASRPVFGTSYNTVLLNQEDPDWAFNYVDFQAMDFIQGQHQSNLTSMLAFYIYIILGLDADSYSKLGGTNYFNLAYGIVNAAQNSSDMGWRSNERGNKNRYWLIENLLNERFQPIREAYYKYHIQGMDKMAKDMETSRIYITQSIEMVQKVARVMPNSMLLKVWFNAKADEIVNIYIKAMPADKTKIVEILNQVDPANRAKWDKITQT